MRRNSVIYLGAIVFVAMILQCHSAFASQPENLPPALFTIPAPDSPQVQKYLGLKAMEPFTVPDTKAKLVIIEFMSALCPQCLANAPTVNKIYKVIQEDQGLASDVKLIAIAVSTDKSQLEAYKKNFKVQFPMFRDENFAISAAMDGVATPTTMIVSTQGGKVLATHVGVIKDSDGFIKELRSLHKKQ